MSIFAIIFVIIAIIIGTALLNFNKEDNNTVATSQINNTENNEATKENISATDKISASPEIITDDETAIVANQNIKTSYTSQASYTTPAKKTHEIDVTIAVENGIAVETNVVYDDKVEGYSNPNQERFDGVYKTEVIGKKLEDINLSRVGGASLTSKAFNEAVADIIKQANT